MVLMNQRRDVYKRQSLQRLHTDYLDLYLIHREDPLLDPWEAGRAMLDLKKEGDVYKRQSIQRKYV